MTADTQEVIAHGPDARAVVCPGQPALERHTDLGAVVITTAVHMVNLEGAGGALAPRAPASQGRDDALARGHRIAVWSVWRRVKSTSSYASTGVKLTHGTAPGRAAGGPRLQPSSRSARARDPSKALRRIERLSARGSRCA